MKKNVILSILAVLLSLNVISQYSEQDTVRYTKIYDNPNYRYFGGGISYDLSINDYNFTLAAFGLDASYLGNKFYASIGSRFHLGEKLTNYVSKQEAPNRSIYEEEKSRDISLNATYFISSVKKRKDMDVSLKTTRTTNYIMFVPVDVSIRIGVDVGLSFMTTYYNFGTVNLKGIDVNGNEVDFNGMASTYLSQKILRLGVSRMKSKNFKVKTDRYGDKVSTGFSKFHFHTLIGLGTELDDILESFSDETAGTQVYRQLDINTHAEILPIGGAIGYESSGVGKIMNIGYVIELGLMPGPSYSIVNNVFLDVKLRFNFGKKFL